MMGARTHSHRLQEQGAQDREREREMEPRGSTGGLQNGYTWLRRPDASATERVWSHVAWLRKQALS
jgi:hypothetical protein